MRETGREAAGGENAGIVRCRILGVNFCVTGLKSISEYIAASGKELSGQYVCLCNVHTTVVATEDEEYLRIQNGAALTLPDGAPIAKEQRKRGFRQAERTGGPDLMEAVFAADLSRGRGLRHYFYGASEDTLEKLVISLKERYPGLTVAGMYSPPFRELTEAEDAADTDRIREAKPDIIWVGLGAPKQERWMAAHRGCFEGVMIGVGAAFDFHAGVKKRAPVWMQRAGLEWLYRLMQEPGRLFGRYLHSNMKFLFNVGADRRKAGKG